MPLPKSVLLSSLALSFVLHAEPSPLGFASLEAYGQKGTTGGGEAPTVLVHNASELQREVERLDLKDKKDRDQSPRVIRLANDIDLGELANEKPGHELLKVGVVNPRPHTTIEGPPGGATLRHGVIDIKGSHNVILRNLRFRDLWENDPTGEYDQMGWDYVRVTSSGKVPSHHIWVDHCDFGKVYDGQLDIVHGSDLVTISWCRFSGDEHAPQKKGLLFGHSSSEKALALDRGKINVTIHHCWFSNLGSRCPRLRAGNVHFVNNLVESVDSATISVAGGALLAENCLYRNCKVATTWSHADDSIEKNRAGQIRISGCVREPEAKGSPTDFENSPGPFSFNKVSGFQWNDTSKPPYEFQAEPTIGLEASLKPKTGPISADGK